MQVLDLRFRRTGGLVPFGEHIRHALDRLALPGADLVRVHLMPRRDLLNSLIAAQSFKGDLRFKLVGELPSFCHLVSLQKGSGYTLDNCLDFQDHFTQPL